MELRDIEIFLTLAEELHFGRTAERLHLTQGRVSQAIKKQERLIGAALFERTSRRVALTEIGRQLYADLKPVRRSLDEGLERAKLAAKGKTAALRVGMMASNSLELRPFWEAFRARHPEWLLQIRHQGIYDPLAALRSGAFDVLVAWLPLEEPGIVNGPVLFTEPRVMAVAADHRLAERDTVSLEVLGDFQTCRPIWQEHQQWVDHTLPYYTPRGRTVFHGPAISSWDELIFTVASGEAIMPQYQHAVRYHARPDVTYIPIQDAPLGRWGLLWSAEAENDLIRALAQVVRDLGTMEL
ncbi:LysR family transcriptional regulator [Nonomuraea sp. NPDC050556]|uniref:LysR family transcriptional regulator n=1 Tax=Nonomuraea sp. NPDC050556 TaxID=3364369 RepID=UPI00378FF330